MVQDATGGRETRPVEVLIRHRRVSGKPWLSDIWEVLGVVPAPPHEALGLSVAQVFADEAQEQFLWRGFTLELSPQ